MGLDHVPTVNCYSDSKSLLDHLRSSKVVQDLRIRVDIARLRQMVELGEIIVIWIDGKRQLADPLTKRGVSASHLIQVLKKGSLSIMLWS